MAIKHIQMCVCPNKAIYQTRKEPHMLGQEYHCSIPRIHAQLLMHSELLAFCQDIGC